MSAQFTPGPWEFGKGRRWLFRDNTPEVMSSTTIFVVDRQAFAPSEADANLIAAAPELYEALEHILNGALSLPRFAEDQARAALAKARGDQS